MNTRQLGKTGLEIPELGLGCATFGREIDQAAAFEVMDYALEHRMNFFDTAENYGGGQARQYRREHQQVDDVRESSGEMSSSELILGRWMASRGCRDEVVLCTKMWQPYDPDRVAHAVAASLDRLQTEVIDLYMIHLWTDDLPLQELVHALSDEVAAGRIRALGCSNFTADQLERALEVSRENGYARMEAIENNFNLARREAEADVFPVCRKHSVTFIGFSPLGAGFLTGKYTDDRENLPERTRFDVIPGHCDVYFSDLCFDRLEKLRALSERTGHSMVLLAAAWAVAADDVACTLFGARSVAHLDNAVNAAGGTVDQSLLEEMSSWP